MGGPCDAGGLCTADGRRLSQSASVTVQLSTARTAPVTILLTKTNLGGASSADYSGVPSSVTFGPDETEASFFVRAVNEDGDDRGRDLR